MYMDPVYAQELMGRFDRKHTLLSIVLHFRDHFLKGIRGKLLAVNLVWSHIRTVQPLPVNFPCVQVPFGNLPLQVDVLKYMLMRTKFQSV